MGKPTICIGENKDADQLRGNREADQRLCFRYPDCTIPLLLKSETALLVFHRGGSNIIAVVKVEITFEPFVISFSHYENMSI